MPFEIGPFQQTDNHMRLYQKLCAGVNSRFGVLGLEKTEFRNSLYVRHLK